MQQVSIINQTHPLPAPLRVKHCRSFAERLRGLMFLAGLPAGSGALIDQGRDSRIDAAIHMFFVGFDLGIVWMDSRREIVDLRLAKSWRPFYMPAHPARYVLEIHPERLGEFFIGDCIALENVPVA